MAWSKPGRTALVGAIAASALLVTSLTTRGPDATAAAATERPGAEKSVTLITGDRVFVRPVGKSWQVRIVKAPRIGGREGFLRQAGPAGVTVIPLSVAPLVRRGQLDRALFDVTGLIDQGLDDSQTKTLPLLVRTNGTRSAGASAAALGRRIRSLPKANIAAVDAPKPALGETFAALSALRMPAGVTKIWLNGRLKPVLDQSVAQVGAPAAWQAGHTGAGVKLAVLDSGYDRQHPDLAGAVRESEDFTGEGIQDTVGHGTHVAATAAGRGAASGGRYTGVAKGADLLIGKVCVVSGCPYDAVLAGMQWAADSGARVVNLSLGGEATDGTDPISQELNRISAASGTLFVVAAGNRGEQGRVGSPASADAALAVASATKQDGISDFSSRGPRIGDAAVKPEIAAPGQDIVAARAAGTLEESLVDEHHARLSGTSMAAPHVAGAAAILAGQHPDWTADRLKAVLVGSAKPIDGKVGEQGAGRLDVARAVQQQVYAEQPSLGFGFFQWPHLDREPVQRQLTLKNPGSTAVRLAVSLEVKDAEGRPAPDGMFGTSAEAVEIPAGGQSSVTVTADPDHGGTGVFGGRLTATGAGGIVVQVPLALEKGAESYELALNLTNRAGTVIPAGSDDGTAMVVDLDNPDRYVFPILGSERLRLPKGRYAVYVVSYDALANRTAKAVTSMAETEIMLTEQRTINLDARASVPTRLRVDQAGAEIERGEVATSHQFASGDAIGLSVGMGYSHFARPTEVRTPGFLYRTRAVLNRTKVRLTAADGSAVPIRHVLGSPVRTGTQRLRTVDVGRATPDEVAAAEVRGKLALFTLGADEGDSFVERVEALAAAGAAAVLWHATEPVGFYYGTMSVPVAWSDGPEVRRLVARAGAEATLHWLKDSPYQYQLAIPEFGKVPASVDYRLRDRELAALKVSYHHTTTAGYVDRLVLARHGEYDLEGSAQSTQERVPVRRTEYYSAGGVTWTDAVAVASVIEGPHQGYAARALPLEAGKTAVLAWNKSVIGPGMPSPPPWPYVQEPVGYREGDRLSLDPPLLSDADGHASWGTAFIFGGSGSIKLFEGERLVAGLDEPGQRLTAEVPEQETTYRLVAAVRRDDPQWPLSTNVAAEWLFRSGRTDAPATLPLIVVGFKPEVSLDNFAPAGRLFPIPVEVRRQHDSAGGALKLDSVEVSFDDGKTWRKQLLHRTGEIVVNNPRSGFVSLRAAASDEAGNKVTQTVIRAYRVR
ncbi:S8 family serine peptidase [Kribbella deserti]|uniref:S8 family serine peptidase n=1 Tax=Kribbella deserti TaxID=1926257 RepID=A0ABV6QIU0_9ACTN